MVEQGKVAIKYFCMSTFCMSAGFMSLPIVVPVRMLELEIQGELAGAILAFPYLVMLPVLPFVDKYVLWMGPESAVFQTNIGLLIAMLLLSVGICCDNTSIFIGLLTAGMGLNGVCYAGNITAEQILLLKYS